MWRGLWCSAVLVGLLAWGTLARAEGGSSPLGGACDQQQDCDASSNVCLVQRGRTSGVPIWSRGYCTRACSSSVTCPTGAVCVQVDDGTYCLKQCKAGEDKECRDRYVCEGTSSGDSVCLSTCGNDTDCGVGYTCRACDGRCIQRKNPGVLIGDPCSDDTKCGTGQVCLKVNGHPQGICSQPCGTSVCFSSCPEGSTCQSVGADRASMCVRTCSQGTCGTSLQCAPFPMGASGCLPPCRSQSDCPSETTCSSSGQCLGNNAPDGGCPLCGGSPDAGTTPLPSTDAGTGQGSTTGVSCGCQGAAVNAPGFLGALALFFVAARRRRCPRP